MLATAAAAAAICFRPSLETNVGQLATASDQAGAACDASASWPRCTAGLAQGSSDRQTSRSWPPAVGSGQLPSHHGAWLDLLVALRACQGCWKQIPRPMAPWWCQSFGPIARHVQHFSSEVSWEPILPRSKAVACTSPSDHTSCHTSSESCRLFDLFFVFCLLKIYMTTLSIPLPFAPEANGCSLRPP